MRSRSNRSPVPLTMPSVESGIAIEYLDGRVVEYTAPLEDRSGNVDASLIYEIHVLVTDATESEGRMVYVNDYDTSDDVLASTGVGRVMLDDGETTDVYPGVRVRREAERVTVEADEEAVTGTVYVFAENQLDERAYRLA